MAAFEFSLERVLNLQERKKKLAELARAQALQAVLRAEGEVARLQQEVRTVAVALEKSLAGVAGRERWEGLYAQGQWLTQRAAEAQERVPPARAELAKATARFRQAATLLEALVDLRRRRWQAYTDERSQAEQRRVEELVLRRWQAEWPNADVLTEAERKERT